MIITFLFGFLGLILNYIFGSWIWALFIVIVLSIFCLNMIYSLSTFFFTSIKNEDLIHNMHLFSQLSKMTRKITERIGKDLNFLGNWYFTLKKNEKNAKLLRSNFKNRLNSKLHTMANIQQNENASYSLVSNNIREYKGNFLLLLDVIHHFIYPDTFKPASFKGLEIPNKENQDLGDIIRKINSLLKTFSNDLNNLDYYFDLEIRKNEFVFDTNENPFHILYILFDSFTSYCDSHFLGLSETRFDKKRVYQRKITLNYLIFGLNIIISGILSFILISSTIFQ